MGLIALFNHLVGNVENEVPVCSLEKSSQHKGKKGNTFTAHTVFSLYSIIFLHLHKVPKGGIINGHTTLLVEKKEQ